MTPTAPNTPKGPPKRAFAPGWNLAIVLGTVVAPIGLVLIEWVMRVKVCEVRHDKACHALEFFAPTVTAAALALFIPCMLMPLTKPPLKDVPRAPNWFSWSKRRKWKEENHEAIAENFLIKLLWRVNAGIIIAAGLLSLGIFAMWLLVLDPSDDAKIEKTWGVLQYAACAAYGAASLLTLCKFFLERPEP